MFIVLILLVVVLAASCFMPLNMFKYDIARYAVQGVIPPDNTRPKMRMPSSHATTNTAEAAVAKEEVVGAGVGTKHN